MATTKKPAAKKKTASKATTKAAAVKKTTVRKAAPKKTAAKKTTRKAAAKKPAMKSFRVSPDTTSFSTFRVTRQTVYWIILIAFIVFVQLWILKLQIEVATLIEAQQTQLQNF